MMANVESAVTAFVPRVVAKKIGQSVHLRALWSNRALVERGVLVLS